MADNSEHVPGGRRFPAMIRRDEYIRHLKPLFNDPLIKVITGMRRVGKSTLLKLIQEELLATGVAQDHFIEMNFELFSFRDCLTAEGMYAYVASRIGDKGMHYVFLDEIQEVKGFEKAVNSLILEHPVDLYITGSNSNLLSGEFATYLTGRYFTLEVLPLSFKEIMSVKGASSRDEVFSEYLRYGGLPSLMRFEEGAVKKQYIEDMKSSIVLKDIVRRYEIRDVDLLEGFLRYVFQNIAQIFSAQKIADFLKSEGRSLSRETIYHYIDACKSAFLIHSAPRYDIKGKQLLRTSEKYFLNDLGLRGVEFDNEADIGQSLENIVYLELLRRGYKVSVGRLKDGEVDFVAEKGSDRIYIQVAYLLASPETVEREFGSLERIDDNYDKYVLSLDRIRMDRNGIRHLNLLDFLLGDHI
ncbi:MAG: ATP-binding protein [Spirochaetota bacterium]